jgi:hypothetical protein
MDAAVLAKNFYSALAVSVLLLHALYILWVVFGALLTRSRFEDALSTLITQFGMEAVPDNTILLRHEGTRLDLDYLKTQVKEFKIDAVIVSRLVKVDKNITYVTRYTLHALSVLRNFLRILRCPVSGGVFTRLLAGRHHRAR